MSSFDLLAVQVQQFLSDNAVSSSRIAEIESFVQHLSTWLVSSDAKSGGAQDNKGSVNGKRRSGSRSASAVVGPVSIPLRQGSSILGLDVPPLAGSQTCQGEDTPTFLFKASPPTQCGLTGPYSCGLMGAGGQAVVDVFVQMPNSSFFAKDFMNMVYFVKRAAYVRALQLWVQAGGFALTSVGHLGQDAAKPVLLLRPTAKRKLGSFKIPSSLGNVTFRLIPTLASDAFASRKLLPTRNCLRPTKPADSESKAVRLVATPHYNMSIVEDMQYVEMWRALRSSVATALHLNRSSDIDPSETQPSELYAAMPEETGGVVGALYMACTWLRVHLLDNAVPTHNAGGVSQGKSKMPYEQLRLWRDEEMSGDQSDSEADSDSDSDSDASEAKTRSSRPKTTHHTSNLAPLGFLNIPAELQRDDLVSQCLRWGVSQTYPAMHRSAGWDAAVCTCVFAHMLQCLPTQTVRNAGAWTLFKHFLLFLCVYPWHVPLHCGFQTSARQLWGCEDGDSDGVTLPGVVDASAHAQLPVSPQPVPLLQTLIASFPVLVMGPSSPDGDKQLCFMPSFRVSASMHWRALHSARNAARSCEIIEELSRRWRSNHRLSLAATMLVEPAASTVPDQPRVGDKRAARETSDEPVLGKHACVTAIHRLFSRPDWTASDCDVELVAHLPLRHLVKTAGWRGSCLLATGENSYSALARQVRDLLLQGLGDRVVGGGGAVSVEIMPQVLTCPPPSRSAVKQSSRMSASSVKTAVETHAQHATTTLHNFSKGKEDAVSSPLFPIRSAVTTVSHQQLTTAACADNLETSSVPVRVRVCLNPSRAYRLADQGPSGTDKPAAACFRAFWGRRAQLRQFAASQGSAVLQDAHLDALVNPNEVTGVAGGVREAVVWMRTGPRPLLTDLLALESDSEIRRALDSIYERYSDLAEQKNQQIADIMHQLVDYFTFAYETDAQLVVPLAIVRYLLWHHFKCAPWNVHSANDGFLELLECSDTRLRPEARQQYLKQYETVLRGHGLSVSPARFMLQPATSLLRLTGGKACGTEGVNSSVTDGNVLLPPPPSLHKAVKTYDWAMRYALLHAPHSTGGVNYTSPTAFINAQLNRLDSLLRTMVRRGTLPLQIMSLSCVHPALRGTVGLPFSAGGCGGGGQGGLSPGVPPVSLLWAVMRWSALSGGSSSSAATRKCACPSDQPHSHHTHNTPTTSSASSTDKAAFPPSLATAVFPCVVKFTSHSKWPDNLAAITRIKTAFYQRIHTQSCTMGVPAILSYEYVDVVLQGLVFRIYLAHERELLLRLDEEATIAHALYLQGAVDTVKKRKSDAHQQKRVAISGPHSYPGLPPPPGFSEQLRFLYQLPIHAARIKTVHQSYHGIFGPTVRLVCEWLDRSGFLCGEGGLGGALYGGAWGLSSRGVHDSITHNEGLRLEAVELICAYVFTDRGLHEEWDGWENEFVSGDGVGGGTGDINDDDTTSGEEEKTHLKAHSALSLNALRSYIASSDARFAPPPADANPRCHNDPFSLPYFANPVTWVRSFRRRPASALQAFWRVLRVLAYFPFDVQPMIVDIGNAVHRSPGSRQKGTLDHGEENGSGMTCNYRGFEWWSSPSSTHGQSRDARHDLTYARTWLEPCTESESSRWSEARRGKKHKDKKVMEDERVASSLDPSRDITRPQLRTIQKHFEKERKRPKGFEVSHKLKTFTPGRASLFIATAEDLKGDMWTRNYPSTDAVVTRIQQYARQTLARMQSHDPLGLWQRGQWNNTPDSVPAPPSVLRRISDNMPHFDYLSRLSVPMSFAHKQFWAACLFPAPVICRRAGQTPQPLLANQVAQWCPTMPCSAHGTLRELRSPDRTSRAAVGLYPPTAVKPGRMRIRAVHFSSPLDSYDAAILLNMGIVPFRRQMHSWSVDQALWYGLESPHLQALAAHNTRRLTERSAVDDTAAMERWLSSLVRSAVTEADGLTSTGRSKSKGKSKGKKNGYVRITKSQLAEEKAEVERHSLIEQLLSLLLSSSVDLSVVAQLYMQLHPQIAASLRRKGVEVPDFQHKPLAQVREAVVQLTQSGEQKEAGSAVFSVLSPLSQDTLGSVGGSFAVGGRPTHSTIPDYIAKPTKTVMRDQILNSAHFTLLKACATYFGVDPIRCLLQDLRAQFGELASFHIPLRSGGVVRMRWKASALLPMRCTVPGFRASQPLTLRPTATGEHAVVTQLSSGAQLSRNLFQVLKDIKDVGGDLIEDIVVR